jgi:hypothetical protein
VERGLKGGIEIGDGIYFEASLDIRLQVLIS